MIWHRWPETPTEAPEDGERWYLVYTIDCTGTPDCVAILEPDGEGGFEDLPDHMAGCEFGYVYRELEEPPEEVLRG